MFNPRSGFYVYASGAFYFLACSSGGGRRVFMTLSKTPAVADMVHCVAHTVPQDVNSIWHCKNLKKETCGTSRHAASCALHVLWQVSTQSQVTPHTARQASWLGWIKASKIGRRSLVASAVMSQVPKQISVHGVAQATERSAVMIRRDKSEEWNLHTRRY